MSKETKKNILLIMVDQMRFPPHFGNSHGFKKELKEILRFQETSEGNKFREHFPGFWALRKNAVVFNNHRIASSACVPSRTALFTGQYGTQTGSTQTDGVFKEGASSNFPWLDPETIPTVGDWMSAYGYKTHYFGKWHISGEETPNLEGYGFKDWELSYPDPHGTLPNNLGYYRDHQFEDLVTGFLRRQGLGIPFNIEHAKVNAHNENLEGENNKLTPPDPNAPPKPWFAVASFTNPHEIASYPGLPSQVCDQRVYNDAGEPVLNTLAVPDKGTKATPAKTGSMKITLNKTSFPQDNANVSPTWNEDLLNNNKPDCQFDYSYKMGLALTCKMGRLAAEKFADMGQDMDPTEQLNFAARTTLATEVTGLPFALTEDPELASRSFMQYYGYLIKEVDQHIKATLDALEESGQADNTIVIFCPDHGEYGASHGMMMEKWHTAYEEMVHVPMVVRLPDDTSAEDTGILRQIDTLTSHIDIFPTILGLAGMSDLEKNYVKQKLEASELDNIKHKNVMDPVGSDLSKLVYKGKDSAIESREGVIFMTYDTISEGLSESDNSVDTTLTNYDVFCKSVDMLQKGGEKLKSIPQLHDGSIVQPNNVHCVVDKDNWKLVRYFDPTEDNPKPDQYELYDLNADPIEHDNLVYYNNVPPGSKLAGKFPAVVPGLCNLNKSVSYGDNYVELKAISLKALMNKLEDEMLYPSDGPIAQP